MTPDRPIPEHEKLIYDWNVVDGTPHVNAGGVTFDDETLRDGLQSPSVRDPSIGEKIELFHLMDQLGIHTADAGLPAAGPRAYADTLALVKETVEAGLGLHPNAAARTIIKDIELVVDIGQRTGYPVEVAMFVGSSPIRCYTENWELPQLLRLTEEAVTFAVKHELPVMFVTEDTTRATPESIKALYQTAIRCGAKRVTIADTVGHATPAGVRALVRYVREVAEAAAPDVLIDWHGHNDRGLATINALTAALSGADQIHATALGLGERCGNAALDQLLVNLRLMDAIDQDLAGLQRYCERAAEMLGVPIPVSYPMVGPDAFRTATGVHAAAVIKAIRLEDTWLEDMIYSAVPASMIGRKQVIEVGPMSGMANVIHWLEQHGYEPEPRVIARIYGEAKKALRVLDHDEIARLAEEENAHRVLREPRKE